MYFKSKKPKCLLCLISVTCVTNITMLNSLAVFGPFDNTEESTPVESIKLASMFPMVTQSEPIILYEQGNYRFIQDKSDSVSENNVDVDEKVITVKENSQIIIDGSGKYNITFENIGIDVSNIENACAFMTRTNADINLTLVGENSLKSNTKNGLYLRYNSLLTIKQEGEDAKLDVFGKEEGIVAKSITVENGNVEAYGKICGIAGNDITIRDGNIKASGEEYGIISDNIIINNGNIVTDGKDFGIFANDIEINGGKVESWGKSFAIGGDSIEINDGDINISSYEYGIFGEYITISGGKIKTNEKCIPIYDGECTEINITNAVINGEKYPSKIK